MSLEALERFETFWMPVTETGCHLWLGNIYISGLPYGKFRLGGKFIPAHRASWILKRGAIPHNLFVLHKCDVPACVNPDHLFLGTAQDNMDDKIRKGRHRGAHSGEKHHNAKLTKEEMLEIRSSNENQYLLAEKFHVSQASISNIKRGARWRGV